MTGHGVWLREALRSRRIRSRPRRASPARPEPGALYPTHFPNSRRAAVKPALGRGFTADRGNHRRFGKASLVVGKAQPGFRELAPLPGGRAAPAGRWSPSGSAGERPHRRTGACAERLVVLAVRARSESAVGELPRELGVVEHFGQPALGERADRLGPEL